ncbi:uncharacterized protein YALI1_F05543t [Yarrowia lipolytica]|uniref:Uncharacterized protein n=1 Tax=Yarrowia lipolytica TaxID=4952 RepID=A0A1D8NLU3_YARLL|nr:hypothetical protein YALI1_F05543t [Yarrowia lipolytica]
MGPLTLENFMFHKTSSPDLPNFPHTLARPKKWTQRSDYGGISDDMVWQEVMHDLRKHYIADANKAQVLHLMRISRLPLVKWRYPDDHVFTKKNPGCGLCDKAIIQDLHEHIFCCKWRSSSFHVDQDEDSRQWTLLKDWIFTESKCGVLPLFPQGHVEQWTPPETSTSQNTQNIWRGIGYWDLEMGKIPPVPQGTTPPWDMSNRVLLQFLKEAPDVFFDDGPTAGTSTIGEVRHNSKRKRGAEATERTA